MHSLITLLGLLAVAASASAFPQPTTPIDPKKDERVNERVRALFATMRDGTFRDANMPKFSTEDIGSLLELGGSMARLKTFPTNPISSIALREVSEGMMAMWLVEGSRTGKRFPSLNPMVTPTEPERGDLERISAVNQAKVHKAYQDWWNKAASLPRDKALVIDPLKDSGLRWR